MQAPAMPPPQPRLKVKERAQINMTGLTITEIRYMSRTAEALSEKELLYRDAFVKEYIKDFHGKNSMLRIGYGGDPKHASQVAKNLLLEPYVQQKLDEVVRKLEPLDIVTRQQCMLTMWKEANNQQNEGGVRVAALAHVAKMLGMFQNKGEAADGAMPIGVMLIPCMAVSDWEASAATAQAMLRNGASSPPVVDIPGRDE